MSGDNLKNLFAWGPRDPKAGAPADYHLAGGCQRSRLPVPAAGERINQGKSVKSPVETGTGWLHPDPKDLSRQDPFDCGVRDPARPDGT